MEAQRDVQGARYCVDLLPTTSHVALGEVTGATPDGRRAGTPLSEGVSAVQGHDRRGPTAAAASVAKLDHARTNGTLLNMRINPDCVRTAEDLRKLAALIRGYFDQGGHHVQFNIVDREVLLDAMAHPEQHRDLMVRVAGYSDYFVLLSPGHPARDPLAHRARAVAALRLLLHDLRAADGHVADGAVVVDLQPLRHAHGLVALDELERALLAGRQTR